MKRFEAIAAAATLLAVVSWTTGCGGAAPKPSPTPVAARAVPSPTPKPKPTPRPPTYTDVLKTFARDHKVCRTVVYLQEVNAGNIMVLSVDPKGSDPFQRGPKDSTIRCVGTRVTVSKPVTLEGKRYERGTRLTVDKSTNWIEVSSW
jgi:hypothetical protein